MPGSIAFSIARVAGLSARVEDAKRGLPSSARLVLELLVQTLKALKERIASPDLEIAGRARKPRMLVIVLFANKMACIVCVFRARRGLQGSGRGRITPGP